METIQGKTRRFSRRTLLKQVATAPLMLRVAPLFGMDAVRETPPLAATPTFPLTEARYTPHYPVRSPLEDVLRLVTPGLDDYPTEQYADEIGLVLAIWSRSLKTKQFAGIEETVAAAAQIDSLLPSRKTEMRDSFGITAVQQSFAPVPAPGGLVPALQQWLGEGARVHHAEFEITAIAVTAADPLAVQTTLRVSLVTEAGDRRDQRIATWQTSWRHDTAISTGWQLTRLQPLTESRGTLRGNGFVDVTQQAMGGTASYGAQMKHGSDYWRTVLDGACGIDVYGNNGVAVGDYDNDGFDDLYVSQPAGLPNRLYRNRGDGTLEDITEKAGVGVLDNTACSLFADFRNIGLQDLLVVCGSGPLLFQNGGNGTFTLKHDAFRFAQPPQGTFTHAAVADYDRDGKLDIYFCLYSYYLGLDQYHYPTPYFDARNGPPNFLMQNQGDGTFADRTAAAGLDAENDRYSFACAWGDTVDGKTPDLYVVNDFGRSNLYRGKGDGTFRAVSEQAHVQDVGAGMSVCWADTNNGGKADLYVANMWSAAGQRVAQQANFHAASKPAVRELYSRHAGGNALYRNNGDGTFTNASKTAGVEMGRWAWCSDAWDFDQDGHQDLYVANGYITAPRINIAAPRADPPGAAGSQTAASSYIDLGSFFWRQVVAKSPDDATPSLGYERGWNALNELIRTDSSWSGNERNVLFANHGDGTFTDVSGAAGMDFLEDGRAFALADLDGDGRLEVVVKNRNAPQIRIVRNAMQNLGDSLVLRLCGTKSNRDAIGAVVVLQVGNLRQTRALQAGTGFLAQHSKELFFGLGGGASMAQATVHWPNGLVQQFADLPRNSRIDLIEGAATFTSRPFTATSKAYLGDVVAPAMPETLPRDFGTWLIDPLRAPTFSVPTLDGTVVALEKKRGAPVLLHLCTTATSTYTAQLQALHAMQVSVIELHLDDVAVQAHARNAAQKLRLSYPVLFATEELAGVYNLLFRYMFDRRANLPLPTSFLLDGAGMIVKVYQGALTAEQVFRDAHTIPVTSAERVQRALPFSGTLHQGSFTRNDFTYGVAMFQHGYLDQAAASFEQVIAARPDDAEAQYNLGTLSLRRNNFALARTYLQRALELKPNYPEAWNNLGMMAAQEGHADEAVHSFQQALALRPTYATALLNLGNFYRYQRDFPQAQDYLMRASKLQPDDPEAKYSLGMLFAQQHQVSAAQRYLQEAIDLRPEYPEALNNLGVTFVNEQLYPQAQELFERCIRLVPGFEGSYLNLARLYLLQQDKTHARATLQQLLQLHPESAAGTQAKQAVDAAP